MTFHPDVQHDEEIKVFVPDFVRVGSFVYDGSDLSSYDGLEMTMWKIDPKLMLNKTANPDNIIYDTQISGTANLRQMLQAPTLASKGHFYQISDAVQDQLAIQKKKNGTIITPNPEVDETTMGVEQITGVSLVAKQRLQMNFQIVKDSLFNFLKTESVIIPLTFVQRESVMT